MGQGIVSFGFWKRSIICANK